MNRLASSSNATSNHFVASLVIAAGFLLVLPSCCLPKLRKADPPACMPDTFNGTADWENSAQIGWREFFNDPALVNLIDQALAGNQELKILNQDISIADFETMARQGEFLPFVSLGAGAELEKSSRFTRDGAVEDQLEVAPGKPFPEPLPNFLVAADISWEIDIWRKLRNARDAAALRYLATREGRNYFITRLISEVAENYYELLALDNRLQALDATIAIQERSLEMAKAKLQAARGTSLAVQRFEAEVRKNQSERYIIQQEIIETENRINFLAGRYPQRVERMSTDYVNLNLHALSVGVPAQLMQNRADIRQAERELAAAGLDVRVARARFYPSLTLHAGVGYEAFNTRYLFNSPESLIYNAAGELVGPLINRKAIRADYLSANARQLQAVYDYQRVVLDAFTEVINRMAKVQNYGQSIVIKKQQLAALEASVDSATQLFQNARAEYVEVLLAQRDLMEAKMVLIDTKRQQLQAIVSAYQALGGGGIVSNPLTFADAAALPPGDAPLLEQPLQLREGNHQLTPPLTPPLRQPEPLPPGPEMPAAEPKAPGAEEEETLQALPPA